MDKKIGADNDWINSLLIRRNLLQPKKENSDDWKACWAQIEECQLAERLRQIVADVNGAAGHYILELQDYLPPQRTILRIRFSKQHTEYVLKIVAREGGPAVVFYSRSKTSYLGEHYFRNQSRNRSVSLKLDIHPAEILSDDLQRWFSYLLSGFNNEFKPHAAQQLSEKEYKEFSAAVSKKSA